MTKLEDVVKEVLEDLEEDFESKEDFLAQCALKKIQDRSDMYNSQLDSLLERLSESEMGGRSFYHSTKSLKSLSKLITISYDNLIKMIRNCEKNIFGN